MAGNLTEKSTVITLGVSDLKISKLLKDDETGVEYSAPMDIPGVQEITLTLTVDEKELTGDATTLAYYSKKKGYDVSFNNAQLSLEVMSLISGSVLTTNEEASVVKSVTVEDGGEDTPSYFALEFKPEDIDGVADYHRQLYKVRGSYDITFRESDYAICNFNGKGIARTFDKMFGNHTTFAQSTDITQIPPITAPTTP